MLFGFIFWLMPTMAFDSFELSIIIFGGGGLYNPNFGDDGMQPLSLKEHQSLVKSSMST